AGGGEADFFARWAGLQAQTVNLEQRLGYMTYSLTALPYLLSALNAGLVLVIGGERVLQGQLTIGMLVAFQSLAISVAQPVNLLVNLGARLQEIEGDLSRLQDVMRYPLDPTVTANDNTSVEEHRPLSGDLQMRDVAFGYSPLEPSLIDGFNLHVKPGQWVAIVGRTGSGKSTVAKLIAGLYQPWTGEILLGGIPRSALPRKLVSETLAFVDQSIALFSGSVRDNLTLWDDRIPIENIIQAAQDACIHEAITARTDGYEALLDEAGHNFSGGERQRMDIARALIGNPKLLVLDEATSALDSQTEQTLLKNLRQRGCACVILAHRLSAVRDCDEIIVMDKGKLVQRGTHEQLIGMQGTYAELFSAEAARVRESE
ncbi:MAG: ATP-binding cassette domain-containing protein, partial [Burkholderiales bacterium]|nr:ATP-binding cassette domain-containing protein [Anaerolineae bacterium]